MIQKIHKHTIVSSRDTRPEVGRRHYCQVLYIGSIFIIVTRSHRTVAPLHGHAATLTPRAIDKFFRHGKYAIRGRWKSDEITWKTSRPRLSQSSECVSSSRFARDGTRTGKRGDAGARRRLLARIERTVSSLSFLPPLPPPRLFLSLSRSHSRKKELGRTSACRESPRD